MESTRLSITESAARRPAAEPEARRVDRLPSGVSGAATQLRSIEAVLGRTAQRVVEDEEVSQRREAGAPGPTKTAEALPEGASAAGANQTGLPETLQAGMESLSGLSLDPVRVHYNSAEPARLGAAAYAQGTDIHLAPGQDHHLPHEAWHVVQQAEGRVQPTLESEGGVPINDDAGLETEADRMGARAARGPGF
jgi:hypothetical protein